MASAIAPPSMGSVPVPNSSIRISVSARRTDEILHVYQMRAVCTQIIFKRLFVSHVNEYFVEYPEFTGFFHGYGYAALEHIL